MMFLIHYPITNHTNPFAMISRAGDAPPSRGEFPLLVGSHTSLLLSESCISCGFRVGRISAVPDGQKSREEYRAVTPHTRRSSTSFPPAARLWAQDNSFLYVTILYL